MDMVKIAGEMLNGSAPQVWRELCLAMYHEASERAIPVVVKLADKYDGQDRWYLEAVGMAATERENEVLEAWQKDHKNNDPRAVEGIEWRLKKEAPEGY